MTNMPEKLKHTQKKGAVVFGSYDGVIDGNALTGDVSPLGYVLLANPIRKEAKANFQYFAEQGENIKVISGDNPLTVSEVAGQAGIAGAENYVDASTLSGHDMIAAALQKWIPYSDV